MTKVSLRGLAQRKLRTAVTVLAVLLGVAFIAGSYVLTDTINKSFDEIFDVAYAGTDVAVSSSTTGQADNASPPPFPERYLDVVRKVPGVEKAAGGIFSVVRFVDRKGDQLSSSFAPEFVSSTAPKPFDTLTYTSGRPPRTSAETSIDDSTADREHFKLGDTLRIAGEAGVKGYTIVGLQRLGKTTSGGSSTAQLTLPEAQRLTQKEGEVDGISVKAAPGVSPAELSRRIDRVLPPRLIVETGHQAAVRQSQDIKDSLSFFRVILLVFGGVALLVGSFLIFNTFSITVAQRIRELGMLRTLGATRGQILRGMVLEAAVIGMLGAVLGVFAGIGFAGGLNALFKGFGIDLPNTGTVIATRTIVLSIVVGLLVTLAAALTPAVRATRVSPMAALLEAELPEGRGRGRIFSAVAVLLMLGGIGMAAFGLLGSIEDSNAAAALVGGGAVATLFGVSMFSPRLVRPLASFIGWPLERLRGITGRLARENAVRKPGRTAVTAGALMIGLAVVVFVTVFAAGISASVGNAIDRNFQGDIVLQNTDGYSPISSGAGREAQQVNGVKTVSSLSYTGANYKGKEIRVSAVDPRTVSDVLSLDWKKGSPQTLSSLSGAGAVLDDAWAKKNDIGVGNRLTVRTPLERNETLTVKGTVKDNADLLGNLVVTEDTLRDKFGAREPSMTFIKLDAGADAKRVQDTISKRVKASFATVEALNQQELKDNQEKQIKQVVRLFYVLLALAIVISLLGIVTTLALSIHERTRELGMLRAVGMSRKQVRRLVRYEAVITALIGAILGTILGVIFAALVSRPLADEGFELAYPIGTLAILLLLAALAGVLAAIWPARRAAQLDVLRALAYE
ncbi:MAG: putative transport system permease protein [Thermoleophilaceae bacterium]|jgi:putative ABC transport system permease protein|nr:putative transport system permease protein [Thermoleophilaceae bacterium]